VASEADIQHAVIYANAHGLPYLTMGGNHGVTTALTHVHNGIGIRTRSLRNITISDNGTSAYIQPGLNNGEVSYYLYSKGKQIVSTAGDCVGFASPALGGGHGWLQGRYGLMIDNVIAYHVVVANGSAVVASEQENSDLFWALRGAGQNFGIVTSIQYRIYDRVASQDPWTYESYIFKGDQLEALYKQANTLLQHPGFEPPVELTHYGWFEWMTAIDSEKVRTMVFGLYPSKSANPTIAHHSLLHHLARLCNPLQLHGSL
jgi:hypothetical protein